MCVVSRQKYTWFFFGKTKVPHFHSPTYIDRNFGCRFQAKLLIFFADNMNIFYARFIHKIYFFVTSNWPVKGDRDLFFLTHCIGSSPLSVTKKSILGENLAWDSVLASEMVSNLSFKTRKNIYFFYFLFSIMYVRVRNFRRLKK